MKMSHHSTSCTLKCWSRVSYMRGLYSQNTPWLLDGQDNALGLLLTTKSLLQTCLLHDLLREVMYCHIKACHPCLAFMQAHSHHVSPEEGTTPDPSTHLSSPASTPPASNRRSHLSFQEMLRQQLGQQVCLATDQHITNAFQIIRSSSHAGQVLSSQISLTSASLVILLFWRA